MQGTPTPGDILRRIMLLRVAKDLFLSDWYERSSGKFFDGPDREALKRIAEESRAEIDATTPLARKWADFVATTSPEDGVATRRLAYETRREFLQVLIEAKDAAGEAYERAAHLAPTHLTNDFLELAAMDFRHATELREMFLKEFSETYLKNRR